MALPNWQRIWEIVQELQGKLGLQVRGWSSARTPSVRVKEVVFWDDTDGNTGRIRFNVQGTEWEITTEDFDGKTWTDPSSEDASSDPTTSNPAKAIRVTIDGTTYWVPAYSSQF